MAVPAKDVDPRVKRTRQLLQRAFLDLYQEKSFSLITVQDIAERATVNRVTFYAHFEDKYALMDSLMREQFRDVVVSKLPHDPGLKTSTLHILVEAVFNYFSQVSDQCRQSDVSFDPLLERAVQQELYDVLLTQLQQGRALEKGQHIDMETTAEVMSWAIFGVALHWSRGARSISIEQKVNSVLTAVVNGIAGVIPALRQE